MTPAPRQEAAITGLLVCVVVAALLVAMTGWPL